MFLSNYHYAVIFWIHVFHVGHDELFHLIFEKVDVDEGDLKHHLWTYRPKITLEHVRQTLQEKKLTEKHPILFEFLQAVNSLAHNPPSL